MITRRQMNHFMLAAGGAGLFSSVHKAAAKTSLAWKHFPAGPDGFYRSPVLLLGEKEAILIDGGWSLSDGRALAEAIKATGKRLGTIYVSQSDPDYYFSLGPVRAAFPEAQVIAAPATVKAIEANVQKKLAVWGPKLKENGPQTLADVVMPRPSDITTLQLEGESIEIVETGGFPNRRYLWVPSLKAVFGGVLIFNGVHVWTADTTGPEQRAAWIKELEAMQAHGPAIVVAGHMPASGAVDASAIAYTKDYLLAFEQERTKAANSGELIAAMKGRYPAAGMEVALEIGAKVAKGEMSWG
jgi:glyoxylase-like metal-dependent hydrolase (beta-lactamase superfamily II)